MIKKKEGSAMLIVILTFFTIFMLAFGAGYLVFLNITKTSDISDSLKAYYAARSGVERAQYEAIKNDYNFEDNCGAEMFTGSLDNGSSYTISCSLDDPDKKVYAIGTYKNNSMAIEVEGVNISQECEDNDLLGSWCGGGRLFKNNDFFFIVSLGSEESTTTLAWDDLATTTMQYATSTDDGRYNVLQLEPATSTNFVAAKYCDDLVVGDYDNWYLPAINELSAAYNLPPFDMDTFSYWSSTEENDDLAHFFNYGFGVDTATKSETYLSRCFR